MDIMAAAEALQRLQHKIDQRLADPRFDADLRARLYRMQGRWFEHLSRQKLMSRYKVILEQLAYLLDDFRDIPPERCGFISSWWWLGRLVDLRAEFQARDEQIPPLPPDLAFIGEPNPLIKPSHGDPAFIVRYSEMGYMQDLMANGTVWLSTASGFADGSLDDARHDAEMRKSTFRDGRKMSITINGESKLVEDEVEFATVAPDYYMSCWATEHDPRLFSKFPKKNGQPADACVIVWDVEEFARRLAAAIGKPERQFHHLPVQYYDAYRQEPRQHVTTGFSKELMFGYQREYRFVCLMNQHEPLQAGSVHAGAMDDIATLLTAQGEYVRGRPFPPAK